MWRPRQRPELGVRVLDGETVVLDRRAERIHQLNETASYIWERCDGSRTVSEIASELAGAFDVDPATAETDVAVVVRQLADADLFEATSVDGATPPARAVGDPR
jgi:hypothetical protein